MNKKMSNCIEMIIISIYVTNNKPYANEVQAIYHNFLAGKIDIIDASTGEMFNRADFENENKQPITISEATVWNYLNDPKNRAVVSKEIGVSKVNSMEKGKCIKCLSQS